MHGAQDFRNKAASMYLLDTREVELREDDTILLKFSLRPAWTYFRHGGNRTTETCYHLPTIRTFGYPGMHVSVSKSILFSVLLLIETQGKKHSDYNYEGNFNVSLHVSISASTLFSGLMLIEMQEKEWN